MKRIVSFMILGFILCSAGSKSPIKHALFLTGVATKEKCQEVASRVDEGIAAVVPGSRPISACREVKDTDTEKKEWVVEFSYLADGMILLPSREEIEAFKESRRTSTVSHIVYKFDHDAKTFEQDFVVREQNYAVLEYVSLDSMEQCEEWNRITPLERLNGVSKYETYLKNTSFLVSTTLVNIARFCDLDPQTNKPRVILLTADIAMQTINQDSKATLLKSKKAPEAKTSAVSEVTRYAEPYKTLQTCIKDKAELLKLYQAQFLTDEIIIECAEYTRLPENKKTGVVMVWNNAGITNENALEKWPTDVSEHSVELISCLTPASSVFYGYIVENGFLVRVEYSYDHDLMAGFDYETLDCNDPELNAFHQKMLDWSFDQASLFLKSQNHNSSCRATVFTPRGQNPRPLKNAADLKELYGMIQVCPDEISSY